MEQLHQQQRQELDGLRRRDPCGTNRRQGTGRGIDKSQVPWLVALTAAALASALLSVVAFNCGSHRSTTVTTTSVTAVGSDRSPDLEGYHEGNIEKTRGHHRRLEESWRQGQGWRRRRRLVEQYESGRKSPSAEEIPEDDHGHDDALSALLVSGLDVSEQFGVSYDEREQAFLSRSFHSQEAERAGRRPPRSGRELSTLYKQPGFDLMKARDAEGVAEGEGKAGSSSGRVRERCFVDPHGVHRCSANIYFVGVSKCATSSFAAWMVSHPALLWISNPRNLGKFAEAHVLDGTPEEYRREMTKGRYAKWRVTAPKAQAQHHVLDYTPHYLAMAEVPYRIAEIHGTSSYDGSVKYLVMLREPVSRTISSWEFKFDLHRVYPSYPQEKGLHEHRDFATAVTDGLERSTRLMECRERALEAHEREGEKANNRKGTLRFLLELNLVNCNPRHFLEPSLFLAHVGKGLYAMQLERWIGIFGRENVKVMFLDDMVADPVGTLEDVFTFLGMEFIDEKGKNAFKSREEWERVVSENHNETNQTKKAILDKQVTPELSERLRKFYAPHNTALEQLLGVPLPAGWTTLANYA